MDSYTPKLTPIISTLKFSIVDGNPLAAKLQYRYDVWALQYLVHTHPEIGFTVNKLCQFSHNLTTTHWDAFQ